MIQFKTFFNDISASATIAGFVTVLVLGALLIEIGSWMFALGLGIGLT
jgi:hypothetical protein